MTQPPCAPPRRPRAAAGKRLGAARVLRLPPALPAWLVAAGLALPPAARAADAVPPARPPGRAAPAAQAPGATTSASAAPSRPTATQAAPLPPTFHQVQRRYGKRVFAAHFCQIYTDATTGPRPAECGELQVAADGRVRFAYGAPEDKLFVFDGVDAYFAEPQAAQVTRMARFAQTPAGEALAFLWGKTAGIDHFVAAPCADGCPQVAKGHEVVTFRPKTPMAAVSRLDVVVDAASAEVAEVRLTDALGNTTDYTLSKRRFDVPAPPDAFTYVAPKGFSVVQAQAD